MTAPRTCTACSKPLASTNPRAKFCPGPVCRKAASRARQRGFPELGSSRSLRSAPVATIGTSPPAAGPVRTAALAELTDAGREASTLGRACLALAARIDLGHDTGTALAAAVSQLALSLASATKGTQVARTALDELRSRRDAKRHPNQARPT